MCSVLKTKNHRYAYCADRNRKKQSPIASRSKFYLELCPRHSTQSWAKMRGTFVSVSVLLVAVACVAPQPNHLVKRKKKNMWIELRVSRLAYIIANFGDNVADTTRRSVCRERSNRQWARGWRTSKNWNQHTLTVPVRLINMATKMLVLLGDGVQ